MEEIKKLSEFKIGEKGIVKKLEMCGIIKRRLYDMGITPGCEIFLRKLAPLGDPMQICLRGYYLTLRKEDAQYIVMSHCEGTSK